MPVPNIGYTAKAGLEPIYKLVIFLQAFVSRDRFEKLIRHGT